MDLGPYPQRFSVADTPGFAEEGRGAEKFPAQQRVCDMKKNETWFWNLKVRMEPGNDVEESPFQGFHFQLQ